MSNASSKLHASALATKQASKLVAQLSSAQKNAVLESMSHLLIEQQTALLSANQKDIEQAKAQGLSDAMIDRLLLTPERIQEISEALGQIIQLEDPIGQIANSQLRPNGIRVGKMRIPLGVILMIYESRPNVAVDAAALCFKAGNAIILRGGKEAYHSNSAILDCWELALQQHKLPSAAISMVKSQEHQAIHELLTFRDAIDLVIPRGGEHLIHTVTDLSKIPVIQHFKGNCHLYVDKEADLTIAEHLLLDGKVSRPGVCNALETLLIHHSVAPEFLLQVQKLSEKHQLRLKGCEQTRKSLPQIELADEQDFATEFLELTLSIKVVDSFEKAIEHIGQYGSQHTEVIATENSLRANQFISQVDASVVMVNASSRFSDGGELGLGAEIGISTSKLHAYGPMGLQALTTEKYVVTGQGQVRHPDLS